LSQSEQSRPPPYKYSSIFLRDKSHFWWSSYHHLFFPSFFISQLSRQIPTVSSLASAASKFAALGSPAWLCFSISTAVDLRQFLGFHAGPFHRAPAPDGLKKDSASRATPRICITHFRNFRRRSDWQDHLKQSAHKPRYSKTALKPCFVSPCGHAGALTAAILAPQKPPERLVHLLAVVAIRCVDPDSPAGMTSKFFTHGFLLKLSSSGEEDIGPYRNSTCRYKGDVPLPAKDSRPSFQFRMPPEGL